MDNISISTSSFELAELELKRNPLYEKMTEEMRSYYILHSLEFGEKAAKELQKTHNSIFQLLEENNITLIKKEASKYSGDFILRGDIHYTEKKCEITVYEDSILSIFNEANQTLPEAFILSQEQALNVHLSHEFFHFLEFKSGKMVSERLNKLKIPTFFKRIREVEVMECSEIAAHAFSKEFCSLNVLPVYYDLHYIHHQNTTN